MATDPVIYKFKPFDRKPETTVVPVELTKEMYAKYLGIAEAGVSDVAFLGMKAQWAGLLEAVKKPEEENWFGSMEGKMQMGAKRTFQNISVTEIIAGIREMHAHSFGGIWCKGRSTHHTVSVREGQKPYHIAEFRHADDAAFCDAAHMHIPRLCDEIEALQETLGRVLARDSR